MFQITRRRVVEAGVRFCDGCAQVTTAAQRAERRFERARTQVLTWAPPR